MAEKTGSETLFLKRILKAILRERGIRYIDIANKLGVSLPTVKRYFNSDTLSVGQLEEICDMLGLSLLELVEQARQRHSQISRLEPEQEVELASNYPLALTRLLLANGWTAEEIEVEYGLDEVTLTGLLLRVDRLGLIELLPGNRVRCRTSIDVKWSADGPMRRVMDEWIKHQFLCPDDSHEPPKYVLEQAELSAGSIARLEALKQNFVRAFRALRDADRALPHDQREWTSMLLATRETNWNYEFENGLVTARSASRHGHAPLPLKRYISLICQNEAA